VIATGVKYVITHGNAEVDVTAISGDTVAADNAESFFDGTGYAGTNNVIPIVSTVNGLAANVLTAEAIATDAITEIQAGLSTITLAQIRTALGTDSSDVMAELTGIPTATPTIAQALSLLFMALRNAHTSTASVETIKNDAGSAIATAALSDDGTTFTKAEFV
jgi:hypothetical protein